MNSAQNFLALAGRILLAWFFVLPGISKITGYAGTVGYAQAAGMPMPEIGVGVAAAIEIVGGLALLIGLGTRWAALALAFFTVVATIFFHPYWSVPAEAVMITKLMFGKNIAVVGGLLAFAAFGPGTLSVDGKKRA